MRVLHLTAEFPPFIWGGLGTAVGGLTSASRRAGLEVAVLLVRHAAQISYGERAPEQFTTGIENHAGLKFFQTSHDHGIETGLQLARHWRPDIIHVHPVELWPIARAIKQRLGIPIVYTVHSLNIAEYEFERRHHGILSLWRIQQEMIASSDRVLALTEDERELLLESCPEARNRVRIIGNGIDDNIAAQTSAVKPRRASSPLALYTGRFVDRKGVRELLAAIPLVLEQAPQTRFALVGGYGGGTDVERAWLPPEAYQFRDRIHFTGWLTPDEVARWYAEADILVVPSWYEPFGMVILEGMLYGLPIAASAVGGPARILEHERTGLLFPPKDAAAIAETLLRLLKDSHLRERISSAAASEVRRKWLWPRIVERLRIIYGEAISAAG